MHPAEKDTREPHESAFSALRRLKGKGAKSARFLKKGGTTNAIRPLSAGQIRDFLFAGAPKHAPSGRRSGIVPGRRNRKPDGRKDTMRIRKEEPKDREAVYRLVREAFASAAHADGLVYPAAFGI